MLALLAILDIMVNRSRYQAVGLPFYEFFKEQDLQMALDWNNQN